MSEKGKVKSFNPITKKGIIYHEDGNDVIIDNNSFKSEISLSKGDIVEFSITKIKKERFAKNIKIASEPSKVFNENKSDDFSVKENNKQNINYGKLISPSDTIKIIDIEKIDNYALRLNKTPFFDDDEKFRLYKDDKKINNLIPNIQPSFSKDLIKAISEKYSQNFTKYKFIFRTINSAPAWRMIVGIGNESVYETSMTLHHIYGFPYIPASAIKGVTRSWVIKEIFQNEEKAYKNKCFCDIFGCPEKSYYKESMKGRVTFFDAMPTTPPKIALDILNPHYGPYYSEGKPPADYYDPKPIFFLTVMGTNFSFNIGIKKQDNEIKEGKFKGKELIDITYIYMKEALENHGIGAKTAVGYGYQELANK